MASNRIAGITIEIDGNTTKLTESLKKVDDSLRKTQSSLKDVNKLLKLDPSNTDLLKQKQEFLSKAIADTKAKLDQEKDALSQLKDADTSGETKEQQEALTREIAATEEQLKSLTEEYKNFGSVASQKIQAAGGKIKEAGDKIAGLGTTLTKKVTAPIMGVAAVAGKAWSDVDEGLDTVIVKTGATGESLEEMEGIVEEIPQLMNVSFGEAGEAVGEVNTRFGVTGEQLQNLSVDFLKFAKLNNTDVSSAVDKTQKVMAAFGLETKDTGALLDTFNAVGQRTGVSVETLAANMVTNSAAFTEMGFSASDAANFLGNCEMAGLDTSTVMTGLKKALQNASAQGKPMSTALGEVQYAMMHAETSTDSMKIACDLFGAKAGPAIAKACESGQISFNALGTNIQDNMGSVQRTFEATQDPVDDLATTFNTLKVIGADLMSVLGEMLIPVLKKVSDKVKGAKKWWDKLTDSQKENILKVVGLVAAIGPLLVIVGKTISKVGGAVVGFGKFLGAINTVSMAIKGGGGLIGIIGSLGTTLGPLLVGGAIIVGLVAGTVLLVKNWDKVKAAAKNLGQGLANAWSGIKAGMSNLMDNLAGTMSRIGENMKRTWGEITNTVQNTAGKIKSAAMAGFNGITKAAADTFTRLKSAIAAPFQGAINMVKAGVQRLKSLFNFDWHLPRLKLPHFSMTGRFSLNPPSIPRISVQWYKKAYENAVMFNRPTVVPTAAGYKGFGDGHGAEIVMGLNKLKELTKASGDYNTTINVYAQPGQDVNQLADAIQDRLVLLQKQREAAYA